MCAMVLPNPVLLQVLTCKVRQIGKMLSHAVAVVLRVRPVQSANTM